jgi:hypothetical protein
MQPQWKHRGLQGSRDDMYNFVEAGYTVESWMLGRKRRQRLS